MSLRPVTLVEHLGLYTTFHTATSTRVLHALSLPLVLVTGCVALAYLHLPATGHLPFDAFANSGTLLACFIAAVLLRVDRVGTALLFSAVLAMTGIAGLVVHTVSPWLVIPIAIVVHLVGWAIPVKWAHEHLEPKLVVGTTHEDSNLYFRRGYYLARGLGRGVSRVDAFIQFCIAPLATVQDILALLGQRRQLERDVAAMRALIRERIARGETPFPAHA